MTLSSPTGRPQTFIAAFLAAGMTVTVGTALAFEHIGGYIPCKLCLEQRVPYYIGIPVALFALASSVLRLPQILTRVLLLGGALLMVWAAGLGIFHSGVEWGWWQGPTDCGVVASGSGSGSLLDQLDATIPPACDEAAGRFLGLSFAGWNVVASTILAVFAFSGALKRS
ncbi:disulfide bond formation protein B [Chelativorans sp. YIM 93263]|uniref:disulfide bond formation protein B n=1 Tax=Chelativorans sp. YIM 93263 TaxID=2906648 RepID=UPI002379D0A7|nr:disulfide bond formation protein B [Chelativorans sp. YIM 93263]